MDISLLYDSITRGRPYNVPQVEWKWSNYATTPNEIFKKKTLYTQPSIHTWSIKTYWICELSYDSNVINRLTLSSAADHSLTNCEGLYREKGNMCNYYFLYVRKWLYMFWIDFRVKMGRWIYGVYRAVFLLFTTPWCIGKFF